MWTAALPNTDLFIPNTRRRQRKAEKKIFGAFWGDVFTLPVRLFECARKFTAANVIGAFGRIVNILYTFLLVRRSSGKSFSANFCCVFSLLLLPSSSSQRSHSHFWCRQISVAIVGCNVLFVYLCRFRWNKLFLLNFKFYANATKWIFYTIDFAAAAAAAAVSVEQ